MKISSNAHGLRLEIGRPSLAVAALSFASLAAVLAEYGHKFTGLFRTAYVGPGNDTAGLATLPYLILIATVVASITGIVQWVWGRHRIELTREGAGTVYKGVGSLGKSQGFFLPAINGICLAFQKAQDHNGNVVEQHLLRLEGVDFYLEFAHDLPEPQRVYIALALLEKRLTFAK